MAFESQFVLLFAVATGVALVARWLRLPYTVALVVAGLALGATTRFPAVHLTRELLYAAFLPGLLFEAAFQLGFARFWENKMALLALAVPGVVATTALTAILLGSALGYFHLAEGFSLQQGLVFGALVAATDPIAVVGLFKSLRVPMRLAALVEGESLLNDGTAVVLLSLILAHVAGLQTSVSRSAIGFFTIVGLGLVVGAALGFAASRVGDRVDDPVIEIALTTIAAYGSFVLAERLQGSGVMATVAAGVVCGSYPAGRRIGHPADAATGSFWEYVAFALNSIVFLLIGFEVRVGALVASWAVVLIAYVVVSVSRAAVVSLAVVLLRRTAERVPMPWGTVLAWAGLRGALSMVLVLGLPPGFPNRALLITMTFGIVVVSILVQGLSMAWLLARLGIVGETVSVEAEPGS